MGLDWVLKPKPKPGFEEEYHRYNNKIKILEKKLDKNYSKELQEKIQPEIDELTKKLNEVAISSYETANSYKYGSDDKIDLEIYNKCINDVHLNDFNKVITFDEFKKQNKDKYFTDFADKDSLASNGSFAVSDLDFRGKIIARSEHFSEELQNKCYSDMEPSDMIELADMIESELSNVEPEDDMIPIYIHAIKWLRYWASKGHGVFAWW